MMMRETKQGTNIHRRPDFVLGLAGLTLSGCSGLVLSFPMLEEARVSLNITLILGNVPYQSIL